jgi:hypothetical protein
MFACVSSSWLVVSLGSHHVDCGDLLLLAGQFRLGKVLFHAGADKSS